MINRRRFLALLGATAASPALASLPSKLGEVGPELVSNPCAEMLLPARGVRLTWEPVLDARSYHVFRNGVKIAETLSSSFFDPAPPNVIYHYRVVNCHQVETEEEAQIVLDTGAGVARSAT